MISSKNLDFRQKNLNKKIRQKNLDITISVFCKICILDHKFGQDGQS